jgi:hypothetical protein
VHISTKLRELHQLASTERRRKAVEEELSALHPAVTAVEITGQASKGQTLIHLALKTEHRAFAQIGLVSDGLPHKMPGPANQINQLTHRLRFELPPKHEHGDASQGMRKPRR